jgi:4a-hydroxytetrahydrobiopterin dehydratase
MKWTETENSLQASFEFKNFAEAFGFMAEVALHAERMDHHPDWSNSWNKVHIQLRTHSAGNRVTEKDTELAACISQIFTRYKS